MCRDFSKYWLGMKVVAVENLQFQRDHWRVGLWCYVMVFKLPISRLLIYPLIYRNGTQFYFCGSVYFEFDFFAHLFVFEPFTHAGEEYDGSYSSSYFFKWFKTGGATYRGVNYSPDLNVPWRHWLTNQSQWVQFATVLTYFWAPFLTDTCCTTTSDDPSAGFTDIRQFYAILYLFY